MTSQWTPRPSSRLRARHRAVRIPAQRRPPHWPPPPSPASRSARHKRPRRHRLLWFALAAFIVVLVAAFVALGSVRTQTGTRDAAVTPPAGIVPASTH
ncbi:hypothetical protein [Pseudonocardia acidicola]|uniref:Serine/threonine protein kinase n=1 Tax=Pseudonocardia acidicola TaxID=2724939 RepID=A0ABX1S6J8_9PSEU|nr:hypothetical protein [Pseudonocardia acidicola]NMH95986.1 hypothetical protein [Pseudonocardia acidicola]